MGGAASAWYSSTLHAYAGGESETDGEGGEGEVGKFEERESCSGKDARIFIYYPPCLTRGGGKREFEYRLAGKICSGQGPITYLRGSLAIRARANERASMFCTYPASKYPPCRSWHRAPE